MFKEFGDQGSTSDPWSTRVAELKCCRHRSSSRPSARESNLALCGQGLGDAVPKVDERITWGRGAKPESLSEGPYRDVDSSTGSISSFDQPGQWRGNQTFSSFVAQPGIAGRGQWDTNTPQC